MEPWHIMVATSPGLEDVLATECTALAIGAPQGVAGGVELRGDRRAVVRCTVGSAVASHVWVRLGSFKAVHLSELQRRAKALPWSAFLRPDARVRVRAVCHRSAIYHSGAAAQRVWQGLAAALPGVTRSITRSVSATADFELNSLAPDAELLVRLDSNYCTVSIDASGSLFHRGTKLETGKAPLRENLAAGILRWCGWQPGMALLDPMCGSGTLVLEAAARDMGLWPGRARHFPWQSWPAMQGLAVAPCMPCAEPAAAQTPPLWGLDRNAGAVAVSTRNAIRAGVTGRVHFIRQSLSALQPPPGVAGWVICNPPYGKRLGDVASLRNLYATLGRMMTERLAGWRLGLITATPALARATGLVFQRVSAPLPHGGLKIRVYCTV